MKGFRFSNRISIRTMKNGGTNHEKNNRSSCTFRGYAYRYAVNRICPWTQPRDGFVRRLQFPLQCGKL